jgi:hypothetical protein
MGAESEKISFMARWQWVEVRKLGLQRRMMGVALKGDSKSGARLLRGY